MTISQHFGEFYNKFTDFTPHDHTKENNFTEIPKNFNLFGRELSRILNNYPKLPHQRE